MNSSARYLPTEVAGFEEGDFERGDFTRREIELGGYRHSYYVSEPDVVAAPPVLAIHGFGTDGFRTFRHIADPARRAGIPLIAIDLLGFGGSDAPEIRYSLNHYAALLRDFCDAAGFLDRPVILGHSMGGKVAAATASRFEDRFAGLVLVNSGGFTRRESLIPMLGSLPVFTSLVENDVIYRHVRPRTPLGPVFNSDISREQMRRLRTSHASLDLKRSGVMPKLAALTLPTLVLWGGKDRILPRNAPQEIRRHMPSATFRMLHQAGHAPMKDQPDVFVDELIAFTTRI